MLPGEIHGGLDVGGPGDLGDKGRVAVEGGVQDAAGVIVAVILSQEESAPEGAGQFGQGALREEDLLAVAGDGHHVAARQVGVQDVPPAGWGRAPEGRAGGAGEGEAGCGGETGADKGAALHGASGGSGSVPADSVST